ncbi:MAG: hypothetical protein GY765_14335 [bacterium]|nr:hypothetical protein [bacterium]
MKKIYLFVLLGLIMIGGLGLRGNPQEKSDTDERVMEEVEVVNMEVPVRVYHKGKPVKGLKKKDFTLRVNGKETPINGFYEVKKKLETIAEKVPEAPRSFTLIFNIAAFNLELEEGLNTFFKKIIRPGDHLTVLTNQFLMKDQLVESPQKEKELILKILRMELTRSRRKLILLESNLRYIAGILKSDMSLSAPGKRIQGARPSVELAIHRYVLGFRDLYEEFKGVYFDPTEAQYLQIAEMLKRQSMEKYVINFYHVPMFPQLKINGTLYNGIRDYFKTIKKTNPYYYDIQMKIAVPDQFKIENISKVFLNTGATFHTILLRHRTLKYFEEYKYMPIAVDSEHICRSITKLTNGSLLNSNNIDKFIKKISQKEDVYYVMTYVPQGKTVKGKDGVLKVAVNRKKHKAVFDNQRRPLYLRQVVREVKEKTAPIQITSLEDKNGILAAVISGVRLADANGGAKEGKLLVRVKILDMEAQEVAKGEKAFKCKAGKVPVNLRLPALAEGKYQVVFSVNDLVARGNDLELKELTRKKASLLKEGETAFEFVKLQAPAQGGHELAVLENPLTSISGRRPLALGGMAPNSAAPEKVIDQGLLPDILKKIADYCKRLEAISLNFFCIEEIEEKVVNAVERKGKLLKRKAVKENKLTYGYQLVRDKKSIREKRTLLEQNGWERALENAPLMTRFKYEKIVYGPLIFTAGAQVFYNYKIVDKRKWHDKEVLVIEVTPKPGKKQSLVNGRFWVDAKDYSLLRIETYQKSLKNFDKIRKMAKSHRLIPYITIINEFDILKRGIRFPSKVYCEEAYKDKKGRLSVQSLSNVIFKDYRFFNISTNLIKAEGK